MRLQERMKRAQKRTTELKEQAIAAYLWDHYEATDEGDQFVLLRFITTWIETDAPEDALQNAFPIEQYPNLYLWVTAVYHMRGDLAPLRPVTEPLSDEEIERRVALLPACPSMPIRRRAAKRGSVAA